MSEQFENFLQETSRYKKQIIYPPIGNSHTATTYGIYGDHAKKAYFGEKVESIENGAELEGDAAINYHEKYLRAKAKAVGLALLYGGTEYTVSQNLNITKEQAIEIVSRYYAGLPKITRYIKSKVKEGIKNECVTDLFGRIRYLPLINDRKNFKMKAYMERTALNFPIQCTGSDQIKLVLISSFKYLKEGRLNRFVGDLINTYKPYTRIMSMNISELTEEAEEILDSLPTGNTKIVVYEDGVIVMELDRPVSLTHELFCKFNMDVVH